MEVVAIRGQRGLAERTAVDVVKDLTREPSTGEFAVVLDGRGREIKCVVGTVRGHTSLCMTDDLPPGDDVRSNRVPIDDGGTIGKAGRMFETNDETSSLDQLLDRSFAGAGEHLGGIISPERRLSAGDLCRYLVGIRHLTVATTTAHGEPRRSAVDGLFLHGHFWFSTSAQAFKVVHLAQRPAVSAAHVIGDDGGVLVHGTARLVCGGPGEADELRPYWEGVYGGPPEDWVSTPTDARYVEIVPSTMFSYAFSREKFEGLIATIARDAPE